MAAGLHVLLVEDEALIAMAFQDALEAAGHRVTHVADGAEALAAIGTGGAPPFDALVTDLRMPRMDGLELVRSVRARYPGLPVVVVTGSPPRAGVRALGAEGDESLVLLVKPIPPTLVAQALSRAARRLVDSG